MTEVEPLRLRRESGLSRELALALQDGASELPSEAELGVLRAQLTVTVGEPQRLKQSEPFREVLEASVGGAPSLAELRALRARLPGSPGVSARPVTKLGAPRARRRVAALVWLLPAAALAAALAYLAAREPAERSEPAPRANPSVPTPSTAPTASPAPLGNEAPEPAPSTAATGAASAVAKAPSAVRAPEVDELGLLREAQKSLASDPAGALRLANRHAQLFSHGLLAQEREVVAIDALTRLGRQAEARARAAQFRAAHPGSAYLPRIERLVPELSAEPAASSR